MTEPALPETAAKPARRRAPAALLAFLVLPPLALAHAPGENYVWLNVGEDALAGRFEINVDDLRDKLGLDVDAAGATRLDGVRASEATVRGYLDEHFAISDADGKIPLEFGEATLFDENGEYVQYHFTAPLPRDLEAVIENRVFLTPELMREDRLHRSLLVVEYNEISGGDFGAENVALVFSPRKPVQEIDFAEPGTALQWKDFLWQGVLHIWAGPDHVLFVLVLLLTTVLRPAAGGGWTPIRSFRPAFLNTVKIVTLFTVAHSVTLSLAALDLVSVNSRLVESVIALSIIAVALNNIFPRFSAHTWVLIFAFGLFHGLGFASVMGDLQFRTVLIERILVLFNVGIELGQLAIVAVAFPLFYLLRETRFYRPLVVNPLSGLATAVAAVWVVQRVFAVGV